MFYSLSIKEYESKKVLVMMIIERKYVQNISGKNYNRKMVF